MAWLRSTEKGCARWTKDTGFNHLLIEKRRCEFIRNQFLFYKPFFLDFLFRHFFEAPVERPYFAVLPVNLFVFGDDCRSDAVAFLCPVYRETVVFASDKHPSSIELAFHHFEFGTCERFLQDMTSLNTLRSDSIRWRSKVQTHAVATYHLTEPWSSVKPYGHFSGLLHPDLQSPLPEHVGTPFCRIFVCV